MHGYAISASGNWILSKQSKRCFRNVERLLQPPLLLCNRELMFVCRYIISSSKTSFVVLWYGYLCWFLFLWFVVFFCDPCIRPHNYIITYARSRASTCWLSWCPNQCQCMRTLMVPKSVIVGPKSWHLALNVEPDCRMCPGICRMCPGICSLLTHWQSYLLRCFSGPTYGSWCTSGWVPAVQDGGLVLLRVHCCSQR